MPLLYIFHHDYTNIKIINALKRGWLKKSLEKKEFFTKSPSKKRVFSTKSPSKKKDFFTKSR